MFLAVLSIARRVGSRGWVESQRGKQAAIQFGTLSLRLASGIKPPNEFQVQTYENKRAEARPAESCRIREYVPGLVSTQPYGLWTREPGKSK